MLTKPSPCGGPYSAPPSYVLEGIETALSATDDETTPEGSTIVGDKERAHDALVWAVKGAHEGYKADVKDPVYLERVAMVNTCVPG